MPQPVSAFPEDGADDLSDYEHNARYVYIIKDLGLCSSLHVSDQVSHPYKTTGKIIVLFISIYIFLDSKLENKRFCTE